MRGMTLLARRLAIRLEDRVYKRAQRSDYRPAPFHLLALRWFRARQRLAHHSPMHPELVRHCPDRPNTELVFPTDLLEQLHLGSPLHPQPPASSTGCWTWRGGANLRYRKGPFHSIEITPSARVCGRAARRRSATSSGTRSY